MGCGCNKKATKSSAVSKSVPVDPKKGFDFNKDKASPVVEQVNKKEGPGILQKALNFGEAVANHVADGFSTVTQLQMSARLSVCSKCPFNKEGTCNKCGCIIATKAKWRTSTCPQSYWPTLPKEKEKE